MTEERGLAPVEEKRQVAKSAKFARVDLPVRIVLAGVSELSRYLG
jgi:hypothetical protein